MEENSTLFKKLRERLSWQNIVNNSAVKKVAKLTMAGVLSASILFSTACGLINNKNNNNVNNGNDNENTHQTGGNNVVVETPDGDKINISNFSQVLQTVLTDDYYKNLVNEGKAKQSAGILACSKANKYQAIPYGFLEDEGYNIAAIKNDQIACETDVFVINNELYIACRVENKASTPYYTHYVIKYNLSEQELDDLNFLFKELPDGANTYRTISFQAPLFIQELSNQKEAQVLSENHITKDAEKSAEQNIQSKKLSANGKLIDFSKFSNHISATYVKEDPETNSSTFLFMNEDSQASPAIVQGNVAILTSTAIFGSKLQQINGVNVYIYDFSPYILSDSVTEFENSITPATFYNSYDAAFVDMLSDKYSSFYELDK